MEIYGIEESSAGLTTDSDNTMKGVRNHYKKHDFTISGCGTHGYSLVIEGVLKDPMYEADRKQANSIMNELKNKPKLRHQLFIRVNPKASQRRQELQAQNIPDEIIDAELESFATEQRFGIPIGCWTRWCSFCVEFAKLLEWRQMEKCF